MALNDRVIIIGAGIGGLATGALLAQMGFKVIILEQSQRAGGCCRTFSKSGFRFDCGPSLFPDVLLSGLDMLFRRLEIKLERIFFDPFYHICIPCHRLGIYKDFTSSDMDLARELPDLRVHMDNLLSEMNTIKNGIRLSGSGHFKRYKMGNATLLKEILYLVEKIISRRVTGNLILPRQIRRTPALKYLDLQTLFWGQTTFAKTNLAYAAQIMGLPDNGAFQIKGGSESIVNSLCKFILDKGGEVRLNSKVTEIILIGDRAAGIKLADGEILDGRLYITNTTPWTLYERLLPKSNRTERMLRELARIPYPQGVFALFLAVKESCLPSQIGQTALLYPKGTDYTPLFISLSTKKDTQRAPEGYRAITVFQYSPTAIWQKEKTQYNMQKEQTAQKIISALKGLIPFLDEGLSFYESATPVTYERYTARPEGVVKGVPQVRSVFSNKALSEFTCYNNIYMVNDCIPPNLGVEGVCRTSLKLADWISKKYA